MLPGSKGTKHGYDAEEEGDNEYNADQTVVGGKSTDWVINGIRFWSFMDVYWEILGLHLRMISQFLAESPSIGIQLPGLWYTTTRPSLNNKLINGIKAEIGYILDGAGASSSAIETFAGAAPLY
ncbi:14277_t:CDS:2 [Entrophospora sp. SA101]|nr:14277_t:CDS:2 [Entrophospora sp. SA101]